MGRSEGDEKRFRFCSVVAVECWAFDCYSHQHFRSRYPSSFVAGRVHPSTPIDCREDPDGSALNDVGLLFEQWLYRNLDFAKQYHKTYSKHEHTLYKSVQSHSY